MGAVVAADTPEKPKALHVLEQIKVIADTELSPAPRVIHKPNKAGTGQALKLQLRLKPEWVVSDDGQGFFDREANKAGGLFLEIAGQGPMKNGNATFHWREESQLVRCKLGVPDITGLLLAIRNMRQLGLAVPAQLQDRTNPSDSLVSLFHKTPTGSTIITYEFREHDSILRISKGKGNARSIALSPSEEFLFERYLSLSLDAHLRVGKR